jgi:hypothetical protein
MGMRISVAILMGLVLPGLAVVVRAGGPGAPDVAAKSAVADTVRVEPAGILQMGVLQPTGTPNRLTFTLVNDGPAPITIQQVRAGCSCSAVAGYAREPVPAGGRTTVVIELDAGKLPDGRFERGATVVFAPPQAPVTLRFAGEVRRPFAVAPRHDQYVGILRSRDVPWRAEFEIEARPIGGVPAQPGVPVTTAPGVTARLLPAGKAGLYRLEVTGAPPLPLGPFNVEVRLPVAVPAGLPEERLTVRGRVGPELFGLPPVLTLPTGSAAPVTRPVELSFRDTAEQDVTVEELRFTTPPGVQAVVRPAEHGAIVDLTFSPAALKTPALGQIEVATPRSAPLILRYVAGPGR